MVAFVLSFLMVLSLFAMPVSADDFDELRFPGGPVLGEPIIIQPSVVGDWRNIFAVLRGDTYRMLGPNDPYDGVTLLANWVVLEHDAFMSWDGDDFSSLTAYGLTLTLVRFTDNQTVYLRFEGDATPYEGQRFYIIPYGPNVLTSRETPAPLIVYIGEGEPGEIIRHGALGFQVIIPPSALNPQEFYSNYIPYGYNPRGFFHVRAILAPGVTFSADAEDVENWRVCINPFCHATSAGHDCNPTGGSCYELLATGVGLSLESVEITSENRREAILVFTGHDVDRGQFPNHTGFSDREHVCTNGACTNAWCIEDIAHRVFITALAPALTGSANPISVSRNNLYGIPIGISPVPMTLEIIHSTHNLGVVNPLSASDRGTAAAPAYDIRVNTGTGRQIVVRATLGGGATFTEDANDLNNWRANFQDNSYASSLTAFGLTLTRVQAVAGQNWADLTFSAGDTARTGMSDNRSSNAAWDRFRLYIRVLEDGINVASTFAPHHHVTGSHSHRHVGDGEFYNWSSFLVVHPGVDETQGMPGFMTTSRTGLHASNARLMAPSNAVSYRYILDNASEWVLNPNYRPHSFYEGFFRGSNLGPGNNFARTSQGFRIVYVTLHGEVQNTAGTGYRPKQFAGGDAGAGAVANLDNWRVEFAQTPTDSDDATILVYGGYYFEYTGSAFGGANLRFQDYFYLMSAERVNYTTVRLTFNEVQGETPTAMSDILSRPFFIAVNTPALRDDGPAVALALIDPFIPELHALRNVDVGDASVGHTHGSQLVQQEQIRNYVSVFGGTTLINVGLNVLRDGFRLDEIQFRADLPPGHVHATNLWQMSLCPRPDNAPANWLPCAASWVFAHSHEEQYAAGTLCDGCVADDWDWEEIDFTLFSAIYRGGPGLVDREGLVTLSFEGEVPEGRWLHIRALSAPTEEFEDGERTLQIGPHYTGHVSFGFAVNRDVGTARMTVIAALTDQSILANPNLWVLSPDGVVLDGQNAPFDVSELLDSPILLREGTPHDYIRHFRYIIVELERATFASAADANNVGNWSLHAFEEPNPDLSDSRALADEREAFGLEIVNVQRLNDTQAMVTLAGIAQLHANAILVIRADDVAVVSDGAVEALVRIGDDLRPRLSATQEDGSTLTHIPANSLQTSAQEYTFRIEVRNDWFNRLYGVNTVWSAFYGFTSEQVATHRDHAPGATGVLPTGSNINALPTSRLSNIQVGEQGFVGAAMDQPFGYMYITVQGPIPVCPETGYTYLALRPAFMYTDPINGACFYGRIPALVGGTHTFNRSNTTIPFPVEYLMIRVGEPDVVIDYTNVDAAALAIQSMTFPMVLYPNALGTSEAARGYVLNRIMNYPGVNLPSGVELTINQVGAFEVSMPGTHDLPVGTPGRLVFTVTVVQGYAARTTVQRVLYIQARPFTPDPVSRSALVSAINAAGSLLLNTDIGVGPANQVPVGTWFAPQAAHIALDTARSAAMLVRDNADATQDDVNDAAEALQDAIAEFNTERQEGTYVAGAVCPDCDLPVEDCECGPPVMHGDVNGDGVLDFLDVLFLSAAVALVAEGMDPTVYIPGFNMAAANITLRAGPIDFLDVMFLEAAVALVAEGMDPAVYIPGWGVSPLA
jgi:hypothetical protein